MVGMFARNETAVLATFRQIQQKKPHNQRLKADGEKKDLAGSVYCILRAALYSKVCTCT